MICLTKKGSLDYAVEMKSQLSTFKPLVWCSERAEQMFNNPDIVSSTYRGVFSFIFRSFGFFIESRSILRRNLKTNKNLILYFPVFHPWNNILSFWATLMKIPVFLTVHDYKTHIGERNLLIEYLQKRLIKKAKKVIFLSENEQAKAIEDDSSLLQKSVILAHPLLDYGVNKIQHHSKLKCLFLGRIKEYKGVHLLPEISQESCIEYITIAGEGDWNYENSNKLNRINEYLTKEKIRALIQSHHVLLLPYLEASQSGILSIGVHAEMCMVVSNVNGLKEQLHEKAALWVEPNNIQALKNALNSLSKDQSLFNAIKTEVIEEKERYYKNTVAKIQKFFRDIQE